MKKNAAYLPLFFAFFYCDTQAQVTLFQFQQAPFKEAAYTPASKELILSEEFEYYTLFKEGDSVYTLNGQVSPSKSNHDYIVFLPGSSSKKASLFVSHECNEKSDILGDGGGGTVFSIRKKDYEWKRTGKFEAVDFSSVGGTYDNCGGVYLSKTKRILSAEEYPPESNTKLYKKGRGTRDTSDFNGLKRHEDMGWMVEIDPASKKAVKKLYALGRFSHESGWLSKDGKSLYMTDDHAPSVFFKFVAETPYAFDKGTLYAYDQHNSNDPWIALPGALDSLVIIRDIALRKGATVFARMEWMTGTDDKLYITETGTTPMPLAAHDLQKKNFAQHLQSKIQNDTLFYPDGALLSFDLKTDQLTVRLSGGRGSKDTTKYFSNPDALTIFKSNGRTWLILCEDQIQDPHDGNEVWWLDADIQNPGIDSLYRFLTVPSGAEPTGVCLSKDRKTLFLNIQHPFGENTPPFNRSCTLAIRSRSWKATYKGGKGVNVSFW
ncbi:MAG: phosphatase [Chitinophagaceae bacterium]|nr:phosphatase [Chitinophagaceae bacterium]